MNPEYNSNSVKYSNVDEVNECQLQIVFSIHCIEAQALLAKKLRKHCKKQKLVCYFMRNANSLLETEIKLDEQKKESLILALESTKSRIIELQKELLLAKDKRQNVIEVGNNKIQKYEEHWAACKKRFGTIPFVQSYFQLKNKIESIKGNNETLYNEGKIISSNIYVKERQLLNFDRRRIIELGDFMINKRPIMLKQINEKANEIKMLCKKNKLETVREYQAETKEMPTSIPAKVIIKTNKDIIMEDTYEQTSNIDNTMMFPKLQLHNIDMLPDFGQLQKVNLKNTVSIKRSLGSEATLEFDIKVKKMRAQKVEGVHVLSHFTSPIFEDIKDVPKPAKNYSQKKLIHILDDQMLDAAGTYKIISKLKPGQLQDVNVINDDVLQKKFKENKYSQDKDKTPTNKIIDESDFHKNPSQDILIPPSQFLDLTQNSQEKKVTFNTVVTIQNTTDLVNDTESLIDTMEDNKHLTTQTKYCNKSLMHILGDKELDSAGNCTIISQLKGLRAENVDADMTQNNSNENKSSQDKVNKIIKTVEDTDDTKSQEDSDSTYKKIQDYVFKKHKLNKSPEFTYTKNIMAPMGWEKNIVTSIYFDEKTEDNYIGNTNKKGETLNISDDYGKSVIELDEIDPGLKNKNDIPGNRFEGQDGTQKHEAVVAGPSYINYLQSIPDSLSISLNTTGLEDTEFPQCIDSSLLLSPKADDGIKTSDNKIEGPVQVVPNFLSGLRKTGFSMFKTTADNKPESEEQSPSNNFNFTFGGDKKAKRGGFFSMFN